MNFINMHLLKQPWGYAACIVFCILLTFVQIIVIRKWRIFHKWSSLDQNYTAI